MPLRLPAKRSKYGAKPVVVDGIRFHSTKEANRYLDLRLLVKAGQARDLQLQPSYELQVNGVVIGHYRADFRYEWLDVHQSWGECVWLLQVEDVKGYDTPLSRWKRKHVAAQYGITVRLV